MVQTRGFDIVTIRQRWVKLATCRVKEALPSALPVRTAESDVEAMMNPPVTVSRAFSRDKVMGLKPDMRTAAPEEAPKAVPLAVTRLLPLGVVEMVHGVGV